MATAHLEFWALSVAEEKAEGTAFMRNTMIRAWYLWEGLGCSKDSDRVCESNFFPTSVMGTLAWTQTFHRVLETMAVNSDFHAGRQPPEGKVETDNSRFILCLSGTPRNPGQGIVPGTGFLPSWLSSNINPVDFGCLLLMY